MDVSVRGIRVPISSNAINEFFELPDFEDDEYSPFTITILCLKAKILTNIKKTGYSQGTITD
ncbi:hypothetical protein Gogos_003406 [Gossypium gossypioides]|uniref:Uncharacterized protein n=1 Tax=Gossypium gossypioides TaxID=34282 RepID=A0A7J9CM44_GOSGO|nr:hypothetical protein [Gossypium gossypioides]